MNYELDSTGHRRLEIEIADEIVNIKLYCGEHTLFIHPQAFEKLYGIRHTICSALVGILMGYNLTTKKRLFKHVYMYFNFPCQNVHIREFNKINGILHPTNHGIALPPNSWLKLFDIMEDLKRENPIFNLHNLCSKNHQTDEEKKNCFNCQPDSEEDQQEE